jgi:signal transduction histidine kinase
MGLGLAIAKHLVEAHGGSITAENAPTRGTIIRILLPF